MTIATFALRNAFRSVVRTLLTAASIGVSVFVIALLVTFIEAFSAGLDETEALGRLVTKRKTSLFDSIPEALGARIAAIDGVEYAHGMIWFGGKLKRDDLSGSDQFFANFADDVETFERHHKAEWAWTSEGLMDAWRAERTTAIVGEKTMKRLGWKLGDRVTLFGTIYPVNLEFTIGGVYRNIPGLDDSVFYFRRDYLDETLKRAAPRRAGRVGVYLVKPAPGRGPEVAKRIDAMTENSDAETETVTEREFGASFTEMLGNVKQFVAFLGGIVALTTLIVAGNTMAMTARERSNEAAVLRTLGFERWQVVALFVGEGLFVVGIGGGLGLGFAFGLTKALDFTGGGFFPFFEISRQTVALCGGLTLFVGLVASGIPAFATALRPISLGLRKVV